MEIMNLEPSDVCGLGCSSCGQRFMNKPYHGRTLMSLKIFKALLSTGRFNKNLWLCWRGEPGLNLALPDMAEFAKRQGVRTRISTNTVAPLLGNRSYVSKLLANLNELMICVDGYDQQTLGSYRKGASFDTLMRNIKIIGSIKTNCLKTMRVLMFRHNDSHQEFYRNLAHDHGIDRILWARPVIEYKMILDQEDVDRWLSQNPLYQRYKFKNGKWVYKSFRGCTPRLVCSVHGTVHPCGNDYNLIYSLGNLLKDNWEEIMGKFNKLRPRMMRRAMPFCEKWCCVTGDRINFEEKVE